MMPAALDAELPDDAEMLEQSLEAGVFIGLRHVPWPYGNHTIGNHK